MSPMVMVVFGFVGGLMTMAIISIYKKALTIFKDGLK